MLNVLPVHAAGAEAGSKQDLPAGHCRQAVCAAFTYRPLAHVVHVVAPGSDIAPAAHADTVLPVHFDPAGQGSHAVNGAVPVVMCPAGQVVHADCPAMLNDPAAHTDVAVSVHSLPAAHSVHVIWSVVNDPLGHDWQPLAAPMENVPAPHAVHVPDVAISEYVPAAHDIGASVGSAHVNPPGHGRHAADPIVVVK